MFNEPATPEIYTLSLHDALQIFRVDLLAQPVEADEQRRRAEAERCAGRGIDDLHRVGQEVAGQQRAQDRKSTRLNSSHRCSSYAVFCLKKKKNHEIYNEIYKHDM